VKCKTRDTQYFCANVENQLPITGKSPHKWEIQQPWNVSCKLKLSYVPLLGGERPQAVTAEILGASYYKEIS
jgi:hypothetical protein